MNDLSNQSSKVKRRPARYTLDRSIKLTSFSELTKLLQRNGSPQRKIYPLQLVGREKLNRSVSSVESGPTLSQNRSEARLGQPFVPIDQN